MTAPTPLPLTRQQVLERYARTRYSRDDRAADSSDYNDLAAFEAILAEAGLPLAYTEPAPEPPRWPVKLEAVGGRCAARLRDPSAPGDAPSFAHVTAGGAAAGEDDRAAELARRWNRCAELEYDIEEGWRRAAQIDRGRIEELEAEAVTLRQQAGALLASLEERTRERDKALDDHWRVVQTLGDRLAELDAARAEAAELRRRCEWAERVLGGVAKQGAVVPVPSGYLMSGEHVQRGMIAAVLRGARPVPGSEGGSGA